MDRTFPHGRCGWFARSLIETSFIAKPNDARHMHGDRDVAHTGKHIAAEVGVSAATVSRILRRLSLNKLSALEPAGPIRRYQRDYASLGATIERVMTDNGSRYKSFAFRKAWKRLRLKHISTKPYTLKTNGKAERFVQTSLG
jgi:hypothetical protein